MRNGSSGRTFSVQGWTLGAFASLALTLAACGGGTSTGFPDAGPGGAATGGSGAAGAGAATAGGATTGGASTGGAATGGAATGGACAACAGAGGSGGAGPECTSASDCAARTDGKIACDVALGVCVACVQDADCGTGKRCVANACEIARCTNSLDCGTDQVCNPATQLCVECLTNAECNPGDTCLGNICRPPCKSDKDCTPLGMLCNIGTGACVNCVSSNDCAASEYCKSGVCTADVCAAGTSDCVNNAVVTCNADGSATLPPVACSSTQTCVRSGSSASCVDQICSPLVKGCETGTERVVECAADGLSQTVLEDCGTQNEVCVAATCRPVVCSAGDLYCLGHELRKCSTKGDTSVLVDTCDVVTEFCSTTALACMPQICSPGTDVCNGDIATTCNGDGSGYATGGVDCASSKQKCVGGSCKDVVCTPGGTFCASGAIRKCSTDGTTSSVVQTCTSTQYCDAASVTCKAQICSPGAGACNVNVATQCNADGSGYVTGGVDCSSSGLVCVSGVCKSQICTPNSRFCSGGSVQLCSTDGTMSSLYQTCTASQYCDSTSATCKAQICSPNQPTCNGNAPATCNSDGSGYATTGASCGTQYCVSGVCQNAIFFEDWEDGDTAGWLVGTDSSYTIRAVTTAQAANGTTRSLIETGGSSTVHQQGLYRTLPNLKPANAGWWVMPASTTAYSGYVVLTSGGAAGATSQYVFYSYFQQDGTIRTSAGYTTPYAANQWYHFEMRNIDWVAHTFDWYINGVLIRAAHTLGVYPDITRIDLYNYSSSTAYWDEISFQ